MAVMSHELMTVAGAYITADLIVWRRYRSPAPGILEQVQDPSSVISYTDIQGLKRLRDEGRLKDGMLPKAAAIESAIRGGVRRVHVITYKSTDSLLAEIFTNEGTGTLVVADLKALSPKEQLGAA